MVATSILEFIELLDRSNLLSPEQLQAIRARPDAEPKKIAQRLIKNGWLTRWQAQQLLSGRADFFLGKYKLVALIGQGGMGAVFKAEQPGIGRTVAVKLMSRKLLRQSSSVQRFLREIRSAAVLDHPNIVRAFDADCVNDTYFLVMEYVDGRDLKSYIRDGAPLPVAWSCEAIRQAALGLQHAHEQGMVHRDIKPANLLIARGETENSFVVKILDMGLSRFVSETQQDGELTRSGQVMGTPDYIAPEQARDAKTSDIRADVFSLGCTLFEMLTGQLPYPGENIMEKLMARATVDAPRLGGARRDAPTALDAVLARMMARRADERYQTPAQVAMALAPFSLGGVETLAVANAQADAPHAFASGTVETHVDQTLDGFLGSLSSSALPETSTSSIGSRIHRSGGSLGTKVAVVATVVVLLAAMVLSNWPKSKAPRESGKSSRPATGSRATSNEEQAATEDSAPPDRVDEHDRRVVLWAARAGVEVTVAVERQAGYIETFQPVSARDQRFFEQRILRPGEEPPAGNYFVTRVRIPPGARATDQEFEPLGRLRHLAIVDAAQALISDVALSHLRGASRLETLLLDSTGITGRGLESISQLKELATLHVARCDLRDDDLAHLSPCEALRELTLVGIPLSDAAMTHLAKLTGLRYLDLSGTRITNAGLTHLKALTDLASLGLAGLPISDDGIESLGSLPRLQSLRLQATAITGAGLSSIERLSNLTELVLNNTSVSGEALVHLARLEGLQRLYLEATGIDDAGLTHLRRLARLSYLDLSSTKVTDAGLAQLAELKQLKSLLVRGTAVTDDGLHRLARDLPKCQMAR